MVPGFGRRTLPTFKLGVTVAHPQILAPSSSRGQGEPFWTQTLEAALGVAAGPQGTDFWFFDTLINIFTFVLL